MSWTRLVLDISTLVTITFFIIYVLYQIIKITIKDIIDKFQ